MDEENKKNNQRSEELCCGEEDASSAGLLTQPEVEEEEQEVAVEHQHQHQQQQQQQQQPVIDACGGHAEAAGATAADDNDDDSSAASSSSSGSSSSSSSSSDDDDDDEKGRREMTINEIRAFKMKRNQELLERLGLSSGPLLGGKKKKGNSSSSSSSSKKRAAAAEEEEDSGDDDDGRPRGMLLPTTLGLSWQRNDSSEGGELDRKAPRSSSGQQAPQQVDDDIDDAIESCYDGLYDKYPHRETQIRLLLGLLSPIDNNDSTDEPPAAPAPVLVSGPCGTGKTAVVRDVLNCLTDAAAEQRRRKREGNVSDSWNSSISEMAAPNPPTVVSESMLVTAYVNCSTLDVPSSMEELTNSAYRQFEDQILYAGNSRRNGSSRSRKQNNAMSKRKKAKLTSAAEVETDAENPSNGKEEAPDNPFVEREEGSRKKKRNRSHLSRAVAPVGGEMNGVSSGTGKTSQNNKKTGKNRTAAAATEDIPTSSSSSSTASLTAVYRFGRSIRALFRRRTRKGRQQHHAGILVVDHAEQLLSFISSKAEAARCNLFGQLLILPRTLDLNLTVVAITNSTVLEHSRLNTPISSVYSAVQPVYIRFPAYRGMSVLKKVLIQPHTISLITGENDAQLKDGSRPTFRQRVADAFLDTLIQSLQSTTLDVRDMIRIGRKLFPTYIKPLSLSSFDKTVESARNTLTAEADDTSLQRAIISILDRKILPALRLELERGLWSLESRGDSSTVGHDLPLLAKYLLLAAFLCQVNRPDRDKYLFSIQKNGRRRRQDANRNDEEETAFGPGGSHEQPKVFRPRTFPMERMLSVYVSLVGLNTSSAAFSGEERLRSLGGTAFHENFSLLRDIGFLLEYPPRQAYSETIRMTEPRYWSPLTVEDAKAIASSMEFPLDRYLL